ncbi:MAG: hypothetical protein KGM98_02770 [Bacteroidota bacterium]|nr:hypothetical protein [Bacteroidota bacterium]
MERLHQISGRLGLWMMLIALSGFFSACDTYNFSTPQPVNGESLSQFPSTLMGTWRDKNEKHGVTYDIQQNYFSIVTYQPRTVIRGICPHRLDNGDTPYPSGQEFFYRLQMDSTKMQFDTIPNFIIRGSYIYHIGEDNSLSKGFTFSTSHDTITVYQTDSLTIDLGQNAILRTVGEEVYAISLRNRILNLDDQTSDWWQVRILKQIDPDNWEIMGFSSNAKSLPCIFQVGDTNSRDYYLDCAWSKSEMLQLMNQGHFDDRDTIVRVRQK